MRPGRAGLEVRRPRLRCRRAEPRFRRAPARSPSTRTARGLRAAGASALGSAERRSGSGPGRAGRRRARGRSRTRASARPRRRRARRPSAWSPAASASWALGRGERVLAERRHGFDAGGESPASGGSSRASATRSREAGRSEPSSVRAAASWSSSCSSARACSGWPWASRSWAAAANASRDQPWQADLAGRGNELARGRELGAGCRVRRAAAAAARAARRRRCRRRPASRSASGPASASACSVCPSSARRLGLPARHLQRDLGDAAPLAEGDRLLVGVERGLRPLVGPDDPGEVAVDDGGLASLALLERELERPAHVLDPARVAQLAAGDAAPVERERRLGQAELRGERERPLGGRDRLGVVRPVNVRRPAT